MAVLVLDDVDDERLEPFRHIGDPHWLSAHDLFVIEGRLVVTRLLALPLHVRAVLVTSSAHDAVRPALAARRDPLPVYVVPKTWMERLTGFNLHQNAEVRINAPDGDGQMADAPADVLAESGA